jgi:hypothetical protein
VINILQPVMVATNQSSRPIATSCVKNKHISVVTPLALECEHDLLQSVCHKRMSVP